MNDYLQGELLASKHDTMVTLHRATSTSRNNLQVVIKKHEFHLINHEETQRRITSCLNAALSQAKVHHHYICDILEVQFRVSGSNCDIYHILESMQTSVGRDIQEKKRYTEPEVREFLLQTSTALAYAHQKVSITQNIAHRDVKPDNVFRTGNTYKIGDFDCVFTRKDSSETRSYAGDTRYMSPQLRKACMYRSPYNAFKEDVFALGASALHILTLASPEELLSTEQLDAAVSQQVDTLPCSDQLRTLLRRMLAAEEVSRPDMNEVRTIISSLKAPLVLRSPVLIKRPVSATRIPVRDAGIEDITQAEEAKSLPQPSQPLFLRKNPTSDALIRPRDIVELAQVTDSSLRFFNCQTSTWSPQIALRTRISADNSSSWATLEDGRVFCSGGGGKC